MDMKRLDLLRILQHPQLSPSSSDNELLESGFSGQETLDKNKIGIGLPSTGPGELVLLDGVLLQLVNDGSALPAPIGQRPAVFILMEPDKVEELTVDRVMCRMDLEKWATDNLAPDTLYSVLVKGRLRGITMTCTPPLYTEENDSVKASSPTINHLHARNGTLAGFLAWESEQDGEHRTASYINFVDVDRNTGGYAASYAIQPGCHIVFASGRLTLLPDVV